MSNPKNPKGIPLFANQLADGRIQEQFLALLTGAEMTDGRDYDLNIPPNPETPSGTVELKSDHKLTNNFIIKRLGNTAKPETLDGPWKSAKLGVDFYVIYRSKLHTFYWFDPDELSRFVDESPQYERHYCEVDGYYETFTTESVLVPMRDLEGLIRFTLKVPSDGL